MAGILWTIISILFVLWIIGFALHVGGAVLFVFNLITGRGARV